MPATVPLLPPELELRIIDFVARIDDEDATLRACAMVSRRWNDLARPSMYRRVLVKSHIDSEAFLDLIKNNPSITELVLHLAVCDPEPNVEIPIKSPWALSFLNSLAGKLPRLDVLVLIGLHETGDTYTPNIFQNLSKFATIKRLEVLGCIFPMSLLFAYITSFPSIQQLAINWLVVTDKDHYAHPTPPPPLLTHIRLRAMEQPREFLSWIAASSARCALRSLNVGIFDWPPGVLDEFLDSVGPSLKELDVKIVDSGDYSLEGSYIG